MDDDEAGIPEFNPNPFWMDLSFNSPSSFGFGTKNIDYLRIQFRFGEVKTVSDPTRTGDMPIHLLDIIIT